MKLEGKDWRETYLLSLAGVYRPSRESGRSKVPAAEAVQAALQGQDKQYKTMDLPPPEGKDYNDHLCLRLGIRPVQRAKRGRERGGKRSKNKGKKKNILPGESFAEEEINVKKRIRMGNMLPGEGFARVKSVAIVRIQKGDMGHQEGRNRGI